MALLPHQPVDQRHAPPVALAVAVGADLFVREDAVEQQRAEELIEFQEDFE